MFAITEKCPRPLLTKLFISSMIASADGFCRDVKLRVMLLGVQKAPLVDMRIAVASWFSFEGEDSSLGATEAVDEA